MQGVAGKVDESLERRDERACATGGGFSMPQAAPTSMGNHSCDCIEEGFNIQQTGIEGDRMSASDVFRPDRDQPKPPLFSDQCLHGS